MRHTPNTRLNRQYEADKTTQALERASMPKLASAGLVVCTQLLEIYLISLHSIHTGHYSDTPFLF